MRAWVRTRRLLRLYAGRLRGRPCRAAGRAGTAWPPCSPAAPERRPFVRSAAAHWGIRADRRRRSSTSRAPIDVTGRKRRRLQGSLRRPPPPRRGHGRERGSVHDRRPDPPRPGGRPAPERSDRRTIETAERLELLDLRTLLMLVGRHARPSRDRPAASCARRVRPRFPSRAQRDSRRVSCSSASTGLPVRPRVNERDRSGRGDFRGRLLLAGAPPDRRDRQRRVSRHDRGRDPRRAPRPRAQASRLDGDPLPLGRRRRRARDRWWPGSAASSSGPSP